jgi:hypothetical protein
MTSLLGGKCKYNYLTKIFLLPIQNRTLWTHSWLRVINVASPFSKQWYLLSHHKHWWYSISLTLSTTTPWHYSLFEDIDTHCKFWCWSFLDLARKCPWKVFQTTDWTHFSSPNGLSLDCWLKHKKVTVILWAIKNDKQIAVTAKCTSLLLTETIACCRVQQSIRKTGSGREVSQRIFRFSSRYSRDIV